MEAVKRVSRLAGALLAAGLVLLGASLGEAQVGETGTLVVRVAGVRSTNGKVWVHLWDRPHGYPSAGLKAKVRREVPIRDGAAVASFDGLPFGTYAVFAFHDEDGDGRVKTSFIGIPTEGVGASNNAKGRMGPPSFRAASFELAQKRHEIRITLRYL